MVLFAVDPGRTALVIVDMQNVFVADSPCAVPQCAQVAGRLNRLAACRRAGIPVIWTGTWCGQRAATLGCSASWSRRSLAGSSTTARRSPRCTHSCTSARVTLSSAGPGFGCFYGTGLEVLLRSRHRHDHPRWHQHNVCVDTTAREAAVHEFRDSGGARARAAKGACRRPGTGWLVRRHGLASHAWGGAAGTALGSSQAQDGTGEFARALDVLAGHGPAR